MAIFSNQASLTYKGTTTNSNVAYGEILEVLSVTKTSIEGSYVPGGLVTYAITLRNTGTSALGSVTLTDNLGGYVLDGTTVYPLTYEEDTVALFVGGVLQPTPAVTAGPPLVIGGINIPGGSDAVLVYQARANGYAYPGPDGTVINTVSASGTGLSAPVTATETVTARIAPSLSVLKSISPSQVVDNDRVTYTFVIQNLGNQEVVATDNAIISDLFDPILSALTVTFNGTTWTEGVEYNYDQASGQFTSTEGQIVVPAATYTRDAVTGEYTATPGVATLVITGTI